jgi:predicted nucleotidyltransferase
MSTMLKLPASIQSKLEALRDSLIAALGDDLQAMVVYGSAVRGGYAEGRSDIDLLVVLRKDDRATLERIGPSLMLARSSARIESMLLRGDQLSSAADVFPLLYDDVRSCHAIVHGSDLFSALEIADTHRRLRIEQELREARIRLRLVVAEAPQLPRALTGAVARKLKQLRSPLHALLHLRGAAVDHQLTTVLSEACKLYRVEVDALLDYDRNPTRAYDVLIQLLDAAIADVDALEL